MKKLNCVFYSTFKRDDNGVLTVTTRYLKTPLFREVEEVSEVQWDIFRVTTIPRFQNDAQAGLRHFLANTFYEAGQ